jgi:hypothetical protein
VLEGLVVNRQETEQGMLLWQRELLAEGIDRIGETGSPATADEQTELSF